MKQDIEKEETPEPKITIEKVSTSSYSLFSKRPIYFLLLGSDSRTEDFKGLSDSIMVIKLDPQQRRISQVSFPRDSRIYIKGIGKQKINNAMAHGGPELIVQTIEEYSGIKIDYYMVSTFASFKRLVNQIGGVKITLTESLYDQWAGADFESGDMIMNGEQALAYCRARHISGGDFTRAAHQQDLVKAVYMQEKEKKSLLEIVNRVKLIHDQLKLNIRPAETFKLGWLLLSMDNMTIESQVLPGRASNIGGVSYVILNDKKSKNIFQNLQEGESINLNSEE